MAALMALGLSWAAFGDFLTVRAVEWFIATSMCILAILKLRDIESFSNMFLGYDLLAQRWVRYAYLYPFGEALAGVLMIVGALMWIAVPAALSSGQSGRYRFSRRFISISAILNVPVSVGTAMFRLVSFH